MAEWNTQRLKRLLETDIAAIKSAAQRDGKTGEAQRFAAALAAALGPAPAEKVEPHAAFNIRVDPHDADYSKPLDQRCIHFKVKPDTDVTFACEGPYRYSRKLRKESSYLVRPLLS